MIENEEQYKITREQYKVLVEVTRKYKKQLKAESGLLEKSQYEVFRGQLDELKEEMTEYRQYLKFRKCIDNGDYGMAGLISLLENSKLKERLSKEELLKLVNHYEEEIRDLMADSLRKSNKNIEVMNKSLEKKLGSMGEKK